jgi:NitT/TauT family transport system substrate-binding protein
MALTLTANVRASASLIIAIAVGMALFSPPNASAQSATPVNVSVAVIGVNVTIWPAIVAEKKGFFAEQGLDVDIIISGASARALQQVAAGSAPIGSSSMVDAVRAISGGAQVKVFLNSLAVGTHSLIAGKGIRSVTDLKGKRVMTGRPLDITNLWWFAMARHHGLDPEKDVEMLYSGATSARLAALVAGGIDATPQSFKAIQEGFTDLGPVAPYLGDFPMMIWHVNEAWARANEQKLIGFIRAHDKAVRYLSDPANRREVSQLLAKESGSSLDDALKTWDVCMQVKAFMPDGSISDAAISRVIEALVSAGDLKTPAPPGSYIDRRFMDAAMK